MKPFSAPLQDILFISGGDQNLSEGILHFVLARTSDQGVAHGARSYDIAMAYASERSQGRKMKLTANVFLCCIGLRMLEESSSHPDSDRIKSVAKQIVGNSKLAVSGRANSIVSDKG